MTPLTILSIAIPVILLAVFFTVRQMAKYANAGRSSYELGAVSTRWLSELRRDEPWTRS